MSGAPFRLAYLCSDPGIAADGHKGASVHFRELARALRVQRVDGREVALSPFMARGGPDAARGLPGLRVVGSAGGDGVERELRTFAASAAMLDALLESAPHDAVYERLALFGMAGLAYAKPRGLPHVVEVNAPLWEEAARYRSLGLPGTARAAALEVLHNASLVFVVSQALAAQLAALGIDRDKLHVMGNGVRLDAFDGAVPAPRPAPLRGKPVLLFVGSLKPWHGLEFLLEAFAACRTRRELGLWIVGDGPLRETVRAAAARFPGDVVVQGAVPHEDVPGILTAADVVVAPYGADAPEYFSPLKVVEAIAARRPLLASRTPSVIEACGDAPGVALHEPGDVLGFARALDALLSRGPAGVMDSEFRRALAWSQKARRVLAAVSPCGSRREDHVAG